MRYPTYRILCSFSLFDSHKTFVEWEAANEIKVLLHEAKLIDGIDKSKASPSRLVCDDFCHRLRENVCILERPKIDLSSFLQRLLGGVDEKVISF